MHIKKNQYLEYQFNYLKVLKSLKSIFQMNKTKSILQI